MKHSSIKTSLKNVYKLLSIYLVSYLFVFLILGAYSAPIPKARKAPQPVFSEGHYRMYWGDSIYVSQFAPNGSYWAMLEDTEGASLWQGVWTFDKKTNTLHVEERLAEGGSLLIWDVKLKSEIEIKKGANRGTVHRGPLYFKDSDSSHISLKFRPYTHKEQKGY